MTMMWVGIGTLATTAYGTYQGKKAAKEAGQISKDASDQSAQIQREAMEGARAASEPFRFGAQQSINPLLAALGLNGVQTGSSPIFDRAGKLSPDADGRRAEIMKRMDELKRMKAEKEAADQSSPRSNAEGGKSGGDKLINLLGQRYTPNGDGGKSAREKALNLLGQEYTSHGDTEGEYKSGRGLKGMAKYMLRAGGR